MNGGYSGKKVLITGAAGGIGRALALRFAAKGASLLLVDVDEPGLQGLTAEARSRGAESRWYVTDVSDADDVALLHKKVSSEAGVPDVLINCAGVAETAAVEEAPLEDWRHVMGVNLWGCVHIIHYFLPEMYERGSGQVVNVASVGGFIALPYEGLYSTSKFALAGLTETLRAEAAVHGVGVSTICPGFINTPMLTNVKAVGFAEMDTNRVSKLAAKPEKLAVKILECMEKDRPLLIYPASYRVMLFLKRAMPRSYDKLNKKLASVAYKAGHTGIEESGEP